LPQPLVRLQTLLQRGLTETVSLWPEGRVAYGGVHRVAHILTDEAQHSAATVKQRLGGLLGAVTRHRAGAGALGPPRAHSLEVSRSYRSGLCHGDDIPALPRTNNDLEQCLGAQRDPERRTTGRTGASPALALRGSVQLMAATATRLRSFAPGELAPEDVRPWKALRHELETRRQRRPLRRRFRRAPASSLAELEAALLQLSSPP
jgi:hypothetical protein